MYAIKAGIRKSRRKDRPGTIMIRLLKGNTERTFATGINSTEEEMTTVHRHTVLQWLKCLYDVIAEFQNGDKPFDLDDIAAKYREQFKSGTDDIDISDFSVNRKIASVGKPFKDLIPSACYGKEMYFDGSMLSTNNIVGYIASLFETDDVTYRYGTLSSYKSTKNALAEYIATLPADKTAIDGEFIKWFKSWLENQNLIDSTVSFYLRMLRAVLNRAKKDGLIEMSANWFTGLISTHFLDDIDRKTLTKDEINRIAHARLEPGSLMDLARDLFMFSFYCHGMELFDIFHLTKGNIVGDKIIYNKRLTGKKQVVRLEPAALEIIRKHSDETDDLLFGKVYNFSKSKEYNTVSRVMTKSIIALGEMLEIPGKLSFSMAKNTWQKMSQEINMASIL